MEQRGSNLYTNSINLESDLLGLTRPLTKECESNNFKKAYVKTTPIQYPKQSRDLEQNHNYILPLDPLENTCIPFQTNLDTRILKEKDYFATKTPCISSGNSNVLATNSFSECGTLCNANNCSTTNT